MLTLAAMHVLNDTSDPFFTRLQAGAFAAKKPSGNPCDAAFHCHSSLSTGAKVALAVTLPIIGSAVIAAGIWYYSRRKGLRYTHKA
jgi:endoglucanase